MTEKELNQLYWLNRETERLQKDLEELEHWSGYSLPSITGMPKSHKKKDISDYAAEIADLKAIINLNLHRIQRERARLERYIGNIEDSEMRLIVRLRHVNGMSWVQIAGEIGYDGVNREGTPRKKYKRFMQKVSDISVLKSCIM